MPTVNRAALPDYMALPEGDLVGLAQQGHRGAFAAIMTRCNQRLFRVARSVVRDDAEAEDVLQESYARAFAKLDLFRGDSAILTWLTRITLNEARGRLRRRRPTVDLDQVDAAQAGGARVLSFPSGQETEDPEAQAARAEIRRLLEHAVDELPEPFRLVFVMREIDGCSVEETAVNLGLKPETVKTRLHRGRRLLRQALDEKVSASFSGAFPFLGARCRQITEAVLGRLSRRYGWAEAR